MPPRMPTNRLTRGGPRRPACLPSHRAGITWVLAKLRAGMSGILGDEMGLGAPLLLRLLRLPRLPQASAAAPAFQTPLLPMFTA